MSFIKIIAFLFFTFFSTPTSNLFITIDYLITGTKISTVGSSESVIEDTRDSLYLEIIDHIKESESFRESIYIDTDGSPTIGYGHHLSEGEVFDKVITEDEATQVLIDDFNARVDLVINAHELNGPKAYAVALFIYNCGSGTYARSSLKTAIDNNEPIDKIIIQYCNYKKDGVYHFSSGLLARREFELKIYNS
jgi:GH24 family phage-related lysozyme (muramidase)